MFLSMNWIRDFVNLDGIDLDDLIHKFTLGTAEVEGVEHVGSDIQDVVVGQIVSVEDHPNSQKLHLLKVDGGDRIYQVVCGAPNVAEGMKVPFAKTGGMAGGMKIEKRPVAGYDSEGMCCSERELGLSDNHEGLMVLPEEAPVGTDIKALYEVEDLIFEVDNKSLTNRPDLWGHYGIAREIAALAHRPLQPYAQKSLADYNNLPEVPIEIQDTELVYRYAALAVKNISVKQSPKNMQIRLYRCGMRGINLLADLTNYIMLELGQPMHAFDYERVSQIEVGHFKETFAFATLDGKERMIQPETLMICSKGKPVAVAGIMGGLESEIVEGTHSFLLESATFDAVSIRKSSAALGLRTDASMRYEKTLDPEMVTGAIGRYLQLLLEIDPGVTVISRLSDQYVKHYPKRRITFDKAYVDRITGIDISETQIEETLTSLGFVLSREGKDMTVQVPSWRATKDVSIKADIIEEITRIYGYDNFEIKTAEVAVQPQAYSKEHTLYNQIKNLLAYSFGAHEVHTYLWNDGKKLAELGLTNEGHLHLVNSVSPDIETLRSEMVPSLLCSAARNKGYDSAFTVFEIGSVIAGLKADGLGDEQKHLGAVLWGRKKDEEALLMQAKALTERIAHELLGTAFSYENAAQVKEWQHPYHAFTISAGDSQVGTLAVVHPAVCGKVDKKAAAIALELNLDALCRIEKTMPQFAEPSRFPSIVNDISFMVSSNTRFADFERVIAAHPCAYLTGYELVGIYQDASWQEQQSVTIRFVFCSNERTLESDEVQQAAAMYMEAMKEIGAVVKLD